MYNRICSFKISACDVKLGGCDTNLFYPSSVNWHAGTKKDEAYISIEDNAVNKTNPLSTTPGKFQTNFRIMLTLLNVTTIGTINVTITQILTLLQYLSCYLPFKHTALCFQSQQCKFWMNNHNVDDLIDI